MKKRFLFVFFILFSINSNASELIPGVSLQQSTLFIMDNDSDLAEMESRIYFYPAFSIRSESAYFGNSAYLGWFLEVNSGYYSVDRQISSDIAHNLDTEISGVFCDLTPTIFISTGNLKNKGLFLKYGLGLGIGLLYVNGNAVLTESDDKQEISFNNFAPGFSAGLFIETVLDNWFLQVKGYGPYIFVDKYDLFLVNVRVTIGKKILF